MDIERPEPGVALNPDPTRPAVARPAATVILVRGGDARLEVLLVRRSLASRVMAGVWVFPGGSVDPDDGDGEPGVRAAAARELGEEVGIELDADTELVAFARWITPRALLIRFDTWFFVAAAPADAAPRVDGAEIVDFRWIAPAEALDAAGRDELALVFPTIKQLQRLARFTSADELLAVIDGAAVTTIEPRVIEADGKVRIVLPGEPDYDHRP